MRLKILGCSGGIGGDLRTTSMLLDDDILLDAGTGVGDLTMSELAAGGWFEPVSTERWPWSIDLTADQVGRLFRTFSDWSPADAEAAAQAAEDLGGRVTEHYQTVLRLLRRAPRAR